MRAIFLSVCAIAAAVTLTPAAVSAQDKSIKNLIVGTWNLAMWEQTYADGHKEQAFGATPKGVHTFNSDGRFTLMFMRPNLPKVASNDRVKQTPEESVAIATGSIAYYGTYTINEQDKAIDLKLEATTFTNQLEAPQKRIITMISADEMRYRNPTSASGGTIEYTFKKAK